ncbi:YtxH domain-containing protein [Alkalihalophilus marmarensis]|uniref:YtxH domain-containing protein n=1 Tax=Alkalihalophilus marmarensis TaxID=521377 RepID=UPI002DBC4EC1|nr:YtxH domain-containing protein [Alkalihalophilus marmarensis]MEC2072073.1 YtxH domain-containing protein [Alkalihalophilus marmarensis]
MHIKSLLSGIVAGVVVAGTATLFTTPESGRELQETCKDRVLKVRKGVKQFSNDSIVLKEKVTETTQLGIQSIKAVSSEVKESISDWQKEVQPSIDQLRKDTEELQRRVSQMKQLD